MRQRLLLAALILTASGLGGIAPARAQTSCGRAYCLALPAVTAPAPLHLVTSELYATFGAGANLLVYGLFANDSGAPLCDVAIRYWLFNPGEAVQSDTRRIDVVMPDEIEWRVLFRNPAGGYSFTTAVEQWRSEDCNYVRLTPIEQRVVERDAFVLEVSGSVRNDSAQTVRDPRIRLSPGEAFSHHDDYLLTGVSIAPGATATYSTTVFFRYHGGLITSFDVSAIGRGD